MAVQTGSQTEAMRAKRDRYVARGVSIAPIFAAHAHGAHLTDVDGREYIDFAGGIGVLNLGHTPEAVVAAISAQAEQLVHACFPVAAYDPYLEVCRILCELAPGDHEKKALLINSGAEAVENAVKIARYHTGRDAVITFDRGFHGRTLLTMSLTSKLVYKRGMGPFAPEIYRATAPYPYRGITSADALDSLDWMFKATVDPAVGRVRHPRAGAGRGRVHGHAARVHPRPQGAVRDARHPLHRRRGAGRHGPHRHALGHRALRRGSRPGDGRQVACLGHAAGRRDRPLRGDGLGAPGRARARPTAATRWPAPPRSRACARSRATTSWSSRVRLGEHIQARLRDLATRHEVIGEVRGIGPMAAIELVKDKSTKEPAGDVAAATVAGALERGPDPAQDRHPRQRYPHPGPDHGDRCRRGHRP